MVFVVSVGARSRGRFLAIERTSFRGTNSDVGGLSLHTCGIYGGLVGARSRGLELNRLVGFYSHAIGLPFPDCGSHFV